MVDSRGRVRRHIGREPQLHGGGYSVVPSSFGNSAAFNGQTATASNQTRVGALSKASGTFTIDHPLDPHGTILNHYSLRGGDAEYL